eukprot:9237068-Lingulodinium_polyedra.AAC.1
MLLGCCSGSAWAQLGIAWMLLGARTHAPCGAMRHARTHHARTSFWCEHGERARAALRRAEMANCAFDHVVAQ